MSHVSPIPVPAGPLEHELRRLLDGLGLSARQAAAVSARLGLAGAPATTLAGAAAPSGYTRERVRQLEAKVRAELRRRRPLPTLLCALATVEQAAPETRERVAMLLCEEGLAAEPFDPSGVLNVAAAHGLPVAAALHGRVVERLDGGDVRASLLRAARAQAARRGAASAVELAFELGLEPGRARRLLALVPEVRWLDERRTWLAVAVPDLGRRVEATVRKMLAVSPLLSLEELDEGLRRAFRPVALPLPVLARVLEGVPWLERRSGYAATVPLVRTEELSPVELGLVALVAQAGGTVRFAQAVALGVPALNRNSIAYYLRRSPVFAPVGRGAYRLCGQSAATASSSASCTERDT